VHLYLASLDSFLNSTDLHNASRWTLTSSKYHNKSNPSKSTTTTVIATYTLPLPAICSSSNNYGSTDIPLNFDFNLVFPEGDTQLGWPTVPGACCAYCHASPNCFLYSQQIDSRRSHRGERDNNRARFHVMCRLWDLGEFHLRELLLVR
jgi:hypothetical protein